MTITVRQLHPQFVGDVAGVELSPTLAPDAVRQLSDAIDRHAVLVFHEQSLDDDRLLGVGRLFGGIEPPRNHRVQQRLKHAELADISNLDARNQLRARDDHRRLDALGNQLWHSDASFRVVPGALSMLFAHVVPPIGGETEFADLRAAYDALTPAMQARIEDLVVEHSIFHSRGQLGHTDYTDAERAALDGVLGPPASGWEGGVRRSGAEGNTARGGHVARAQRHLLLPALWALQVLSDLLLVASNSGINAVPVEMALEGKARGLTVVVVTSVAHSRAQTPRHASGKRLFEVADHVLDNGGAPGDVAVPVPGGPAGARMGPTSGVVGAFLVTAWIVRIAERLAARGIEPPVYVSANVAGGDAHNREAEAPYRGRIRLLG